MQQEGTHAVHEGRNVKRRREILGIKQDALALDLGISQQAISALEQKEALDRDMLEKVAKALKVSPETIRNFNDESLVNHVQNNYDHSIGVNYNFNSVDGLMKALEENKKLYERLLQSEKEKVGLLQKMLEERK